jgi:hypothetical protein
MLQTLWQCMTGNILDFGLKPLGVWDNDAAKLFSAIGADVVNLVAVHIIK